MSELSGNGVKLFPNLSPEEREIAWAEHKKKQAREYYLKKNPNATKRSGSYKKLNKMSNNERKFRKSKRDSVYYKNNKQKCLKRNNETRKKNRDIKKEYSDNIKYSGCIICGIKDIPCLEFHHIDPNNKAFNVNKLIWNGSFDKLKIEIDKCEVVCKNCHVSSHIDDNWYKNLNYTKKTKDKKLLCSNVKFIFGCYFCGESNPTKLCFHHLEPKDKGFNISRRHTDAKISIEDLQEEISKCEVLCHNCHCKVHEEILFLENPRKIL